MMGEAGYDATDITCGSAVKFVLFLCEIKLNASIQSPHESGLYCRSATVSTKNGLSLDTLIGSSSLRDELPTLRAVKMIGSLLSRKTLDWLDGESVNSGVTAWLLDHLVRSRQDVRRVYTPTDWAPKVEIPEPCVL
jgi:hypothetical protein